MGGSDSWFINKDNSGSPSSHGWSTQFHLPLIHDAPTINSSLKLHDLNSFSSSLPSVFRRTLNVSSSSNGDRPVNGVLEDSLEPLDGELVSQAIGDLLPDDEEELLAGIVSGFNSNNASNRAAEENEDFDLFSNLGGLEMDGELQEGFGAHVASRPKLVTDGYGTKLPMDGFYSTGTSFQGSANGPPGSVVGEHPYGEHPSRTLFVRNINSNVEDSELRALFEHYGDIRTLYTACKHRGFVMISYYDIRAAKSAMRALQNKPLRRRKLDIHFSIPKDNPSDKDLNQGTLVVFNLDSSVSNDDLRHIFGQYGEVKEIRETPHKCHHKFIEFYDVRAAEAALRALNRSDIAGKRIKLEPSRPGGARRSWMQHISQDPPEQDDARVVWPQSSPPVSNSPLGHLPSWGHFGSPLESGASWSTRHSYGTPVSSMSKTLSGLSNSLHSNSMHVRTIGNHFGWNSQNDAGLSLLHTSLSGKSIHSHHAHSLPEHRNEITSYNTASLIPSSVRTMQSRSQQLISDSEGLRIPRAGPGMLKTAASQQLKFSSGRQVFRSDSHFLWDSSNVYEQSVSPIMWKNSPSMSQASSPAQFKESFNGFAGNHRHLTSASCRHQVGSAPSGDSSFMERQFACLQPPIDATGFAASRVESFNSVLGRSGNDMMNSSHHVINGNLGSEVLFQSGSVGLASPHRNLVFPNHGPPISSSFDMLSFDRWHLQQPESSVGQITENKSQYQLDIDRIMRGEDNRTTLMIKNIPNKYTSKMLLAAIDENHRGMYDFLYLPIDFKNKCNVGYAFINMTSPNHIVSLYQAFNGKKWEKFNSEKVASLAYARIQGKAALVAHFQNSSLMNEDKRCRPILFHSSGSETGEQELPFVEMGIPGGIRDLIGLSNYDFLGDKEVLTSGNPVICSSAKVDPNSE